MSGFENLLRRRDLAPQTRLECGICWWVYDPEEGDPGGQVATGTPFAALPEDWTCPGCGAAAAQFMVLGDAG